MNAIVRNTIAGVSGIVAAFATVAGMEAVGEWLHPLPTGLDASDSAALAAYVHSMPADAFALIAAGWFLAVVAGTFVAVLIARSQPQRFAYVVGAVVLCATVLNFVLISHPVWFVVAGLVAVTVATFVAARFSRRLTRHST